MIEFIVHNADDLVCEIGIGIEIGIGSSLSINYLYQKMEFFSNLNTFLTIIV